jgi:RNA polymerase sigma-70 factor, ECF subfamily
VGWGLVRPKTPAARRTGGSGLLRITSRTARDAYWRARLSGPLNGLDDHLAQLEDPDSELGRLWDRDHDEFIVRRLMELIEPEFAPSTWKSFRLLVLEERPAADVAESLGLSVNAVLIAKSRVLRRLRQEGRDLIA